jgi:transcriptional regulator with XRE-family HTH domain
MLDTFFFLLYKETMKLNTKRIEKELVKHGWTKYRFSKELGVSPQWVYSLLKDEKSHTFKTIERISKALALREKDIIE